MKPNKARSSPEIFDSQRILAGVSNTAFGVKPLPQHIDLRCLRKLRGFTQAELAKRLGIHQNNISRLERSSDMQISTLRTYLSNMGAGLELRACIDGEVIVLRFPQAMEQQNGLAVSV